MVISEDSHDPIQEDDEQEMRELVSSDSTAAVALPLPSQYCVINTKRQRLQHFVNRILSVSLNAFLNSVSPIHRLPHELLVEVF